MIACTNCVYLDGNNRCRHPSKQRVGLKAFFGSRPYCVFMPPTYGDPDRDLLMEMMHCDLREERPRPAAPKSFERSVVNFTRNTADAILELRTQVSKLESEVSEIKAKLEKSND
jgi:hypothetical protein